MAVKKHVKLVLPYVSERLNLMESIKSEVDLNPIKFPRELGETHPFEFKKCEDICINFALAKTGIDKHLDFIISRGFYINSKNKKAKLLINDMIQNTGFTIHLREWIEEALKKGNGFMELGIEKDTVKFRVINANNVYVKRKKNGDIINYNQYIGNSNMFNPDKVIDLKLNVAHLAISKLPGSAYGLGIIRPSFKIIENMVRSNKDQHILLSRKANNPIIANVGTEEEPANQDDITALGQKFEYLNNLHEWAFDHRVKLSVLDFGQITDKFNGVMDQDKLEFFMALQVPAVLMGDSQQNEGIAKVQLDTFERRIQSLQEQIERIIEEQIFKPFLKLNGIDAHVEIEWGQPSEEAINLRIDKLTILLNNIQLNPNLRRMIEIDIAQNLNYDEKDINLLPKPELDLEQERDEEGNIKQPEIPGEKPSSSEKLSEAWDWEVEEFIKKVGDEYCVFSEEGKNFGCYKTKDEAEKRLSQIHSFASVEKMSIEEFINLKEIKGFNYKEYIKFILRQIKTDEFKDLKAMNNIQINEGLLPKEDIEELRNILYSGFKKNKSVIEIESDIRKNIQFKDRLVEGKIVLSAENRPSVITRTETVRLANEGIVSLYKSNDIKEVRWLSSISDRTCPRCLELDGKIFNINELNVGQNQPPLHPQCRCALLSVT